MSDLYTDMEHTKRLLAGQATPAFTPAPEAVLKMLDPAFFPGMGALREDKHGRLQCPVRGCGEWHAFLGSHWTRRHRAIGKISVLRSALSIPTRVTLLSEKYHRSYDRRTPETRQRIANALRKPVNRKTGWTIHTRNLHDSCPAQLQEKLRALQLKIGRSPSVADFTVEYGPAATFAVKSVFGSWNAGKAAAGLEANPVGGPRRINKNLVLESLRAWYTAHGDLPSAHDWRRGIAPWLPSPAVILRAFEVSTWAVAMRAASMELGVSSISYPPHINGLSKSRRSVADILSSFSKWIHAHGDLPRIRSAKGKGPLPAPATIFRALNVSSWPEAMRLVGERLSIKSDRYGFDFRRKGAA